MRSREALRRLGLPEQAILADDRRAPLWPTGVVGSITHCAGFTAAAVAWRRDIATLGIDTEPLGELDDADAAIVATTAERQQASDHSARMPDGSCSAPRSRSTRHGIQLTRRWLDFDDVTVSVTRGGTFAVVPGQHLDSADQRSSARSGDASPSAPSTCSPPCTRRTRQHGAMTDDRIGIGSDLTVNRLGFGAMRLTGDGIWGDPPDRRRRRRCCDGPWSWASHSSTLPTPTAPTSARRSSPRPCIPIRTVW